MALPASSVTDGNGIGFWRHWQGVCGRSGVRIAGSAEKRSVSHQFWRRFARQSCAGPRFLEDRDRAARKGGRGLEDSGIGARYTCDERRLTTLSIERWRTVRTHFGSSYRLARCRRAALSDGGREQLHGGRIACNVGTTPGGSGKRTLREGRCALLARA